MRVLVLVVALMFSQAPAAEMKWSDFPRERTHEACMYLMMLLGPAFVYFRWEKELTQDQVHAEVKPDPDVPQWVVDTTHKWIGYLYASRDQPHFFGAVTEDCNTKQLSL